MFVSYTAQAALLLATSGEGLALVTAVLAAVAAAISTCIAAWQGVLMKSSERKRTQPIVVAYERADPTREGDDLIFAVSLANAGVGPAFNIRFGITLDGVESAYRAQPAGAHRAGDVPRALGPGRTLPPDGADPYRLVVRDAAAPGAGALEKRFYWCRYENAFGRGWETENAWQPDMELHIDPCRIGRAATSHYRISYVPSGAPNPANTGLKPPAKTADKHLWRRMPSARFGGLWSF